MRSMDYAESLANYAQVESVHVLRSPRNSRRLLDAIDRLESTHEAHE